MKKNFHTAVSTLIVISSYLIIIMAVLLSNRSGQIDVKEGDVSPIEVYAPRTIVDETTTNAKKKAARESVENVYICNDDIRIAAVASASDFFSYAESLRSFDNEDKLSAVVAQLKASTKLNLSDKTYTAVVSADSKTFAVFRKIPDIIDDEMSKGISEVSVSVQNCVKKMKKYQLSESQTDAVKDIFSALVKTNLELDEAETERRRVAAENSVTTIEYKKNQVILRKGDIVSAAQLNMLNTLGLIKGTSPLSFTYTLGILLVSILCLLILLYYLSINPITPTGFSIMSIVGAIAIMLVFYGSKYLSSTMILILPTALFSCVAALFASSNAAAAANIVIAVLSGIILDSDWSYSVAMIIFGSICAYSFGKIKRRSHLLSASSVCVFGTGAVFFAISLIESSDIKHALLAFGEGFANGIISVILTIGSIPFWEWLFNATTPMKLTELANPENKLLKKLLIEAPGTYHHSLTVANIAEIAAREIRADSLLARVGAYYHDIGKLRHPLYFKENQYQINEHDSLSPEESASIIINHVKDGVDMAKRHRLPSVICDIIAQHHGTTATGYFLLRAKEKDPDVDTSLFTYPGPNPQTKEAGIVMLADSCEAAVRSITEKNEEKIDAMVRKIVNERVSSGQLSECNLTFAELETVIKVIIKTLGGYFHERIKYE